MDEFFINDNEDKSLEKIVTSPSGKYKLTIKSYKTSNGERNTWGYTRGIINRTSDGKLICDIKRNYSFSSI